MTTRKEEATIRPLAETTVPLASRHSKKSRRYEEFFNLSEEGIVFHELMNGRFVEANPAICRMLGYSREEMLTLSPHDLIAPEDREIPCSDLTQEGACRHEKTLVTKDGRRIRAEFTSRLYNQDGKSMVMSGIRDITERKRTEATLRESEERLRSLAENVPCVLMRFDRQYRIIFLNRHSERYNPNPVEKMVGRTNREMGMPDHLCNLWDAAIERVFNTGNQEEMEFDFEGPSGLRTFALSSHLNSVRIMRFNTCLGSLRISQSTSGSRRHCGRARNWRGNGWRSWRTFTTVRRWVCACSIATCGSSESTNDWPRSTEFPSPTTSARPFAS